MKQRLMAAQELVICLLLGINSPPARAQNWSSTGSPITNWQAVACSSDGTTLVAAVNGGPVYTSTNKGSTWIPSTAPITNWASIACSADGQVLLALTPQGPMYISTNAGSTWLPNNELPAVGEWRSLACSAEGRLILAGSTLLFHSQISISTNLGGTWTTTDVNGDLKCTGCSADGRIMLAGMQGAVPLPLSISTNWGASWQSSPLGPVWSVGSSADGGVLIASRQDNPRQPVFTSTNLGSAWSEVTDLALSGTKVGISADGRTMVACANLYDQTSAAFVTHDSGATWSTKGFPSLVWASVASSADGSVLVAAPTSGPIYLYATTPTPLLNIIPSSNDLLLSWTVPSINLVLEETSDLTSAMWVAVRVAPVLNYTNLHYEVTLARPAGPRFYRLISK